MDPLESTTDSSGIGKRSKGEEGDEATIPDIKSTTKDEAADAEAHHVQEK